MGRRVYRRAGPWYLLAWRMRSWFCRGGAGIWQSKSGEVRITVCPSCHRCSVSARGCQALAWHDRDLPRLLEAMEFAMTKMGAEVAASELRVIAAEYEAAGAEPFPPSGRD